MACDAMRILKPIVAILLLFGFALSDVLSETVQKSADSNHYLGVLLSGGIGSYREDLVVPISFDGPTFALGGQYSRQTEHTSLQLRLNLSVALLKNRFSHEAYAASLELRPSWTKRIWSGMPDKQIWFGIALPMQMRNLFWDSWDDSHLYWLTTYSFALVGEYHTRLPRLGNTVIRLDMPIIGFVSRPPEYRYKKQEALNHFSYHLSAPNKSFVFKGIWGYQSPMLQLLITGGSNGARRGFGLELMLDHCVKPKDIWILQIKLLFRYQWKIG